jgi:Peptidase S24-like
MALSNNQLLYPLEEWIALAGELLQCDHTVRLRVRGRSMHPAIRDGEVVWIAPVMGEGLRVGQVVLFRGTNGRPIIHRIVSRQQAGGGWRFLIASDYASVPGEWVSAAQILGRVVALERTGRRIALDGLTGRVWGWAWGLLRPLRPVLGRLRAWANRLAGRVCDV